MSLTLLGSIDSMALLAEAVKIGRGSDEPTNGMLAAS